MTLDDDMRTATDERYAALLELHRRRREGARRFADDKRERRRHGLAARHRNKLNRLDQEET